MDLETFKCDVLDVLQNDNRAVLRTWTSSCREFRARVSAKIEETLLYKRDCTQKKSANTGRISELQQEIDTVKSKVDATVLEQKIMDKKISNAAKSQENLQSELDEAKVQRDALSLEMVDLQLEMEQRKRKKISQWDAIKRACNIYKVNLDIHIGLQEEKSRQCIKISFFMHNEATRDKYFAQLSHSDDHWSVEQIEPKLSKEHFKELNAVTGFSENPKVSDITLFLYEVRNIYLKHYMKMRKKMLTS